INWSIPELMKYTFTEPEKTKRSLRHAGVASKFLTGKDKVTPGQILQLWDKSADGRIEREENMFSTTIHYSAIKPVRPSLTSYAAQKCLQKVNQEGSAVVKSDAGLHASIRKDSTQKLEWKAVATHALAALLYKRNSEARLLPMSLGLLAFSYSTPVDFMAYCSHIGVMPAWTTISKALNHLGKFQGELVRSLGRDPKLVGFIQTDNVQNYLRMRDERIGSANTMNIGLAATYCQVPGVDPSTLDFDKKQKLVEQNKRSKLTVNQLVSLIDFAHLNKVFVLHWMRVLVHYIPELQHLKSAVSELFRTRVKRTCIPEGATPVFPLASNGKNENVTTELNDAIRDFLSQTGQDENDYLRRVTLIGGDGLTFQRLLELQRYLQFHADQLESLSLIEPILAVWHTEWADLTRIFERFWEAALSTDPSSLGHNATLIGRPGPSNIHKVDYYLAVDLLYLVLESASSIRLIQTSRIHFKDAPDIFKYFTNLAMEGKLPTLEVLEKAAEKLHNTYTTTRAIYEALGDTTAKSPWTNSVPLGKKWGSQERDATSLPKVATEVPEDTQGRHENGDRVLANSITFMRDALLSREISYAVAEGDAGRVYQVMKMLLFSFAGSSHTKYCTYMLEVVTRFELETPEDMVETILKATLVNLTGLPGSCMASDIMQEYFNRLLEAIIEKKGIDYGNPLARNIISPNLAHFARIKLNLRSGVGLAPRSGKHSAPHQNPEMLKLMKAYMQHELHKRRPGR
ncbi:hypothetical protein FA13DRAFT_1600942, partial [Coprinellus micaceus]